MSTRSFRTNMAVIGLTGLMGMTPVQLFAQTNWTRKASMPTARTGMSACVVNGSIYAIGGGVRNQVVTSAVEQYDPVTDTWMEKANMPTPRSFFGAGVVNEKIYVIGGWVAPNTHTPAVEEYDPVTDIWTTRTPMPTAKDHLCCGVANGKIYAFGGLSATTGASRAVEEYDPATDTWASKANMPAVRGAASCCTIDGVIYVVGGFRTAFTGAGSDQAVPTVEAYNPASDTWTTNAPMLMARAFFSTCLMNGKIYAIGGCRNAYNSSETTTIEAYDPAMDKWWRMASMQIKRKALAAAVVNGKIYAIGGVSQAGWEPALSTVEEYDPSPKVSIVPSGFNLKIFWNGILQSTDTLDGLSWQDVNPPAYPWLVNPNSAGAMKFYRAREF